MVFMNPDRVELESNTCAYSFVWVYASLRLEVPPSIGIQGVGESIGYEGSWCW